MQIARFEEWERDDTIAEGTSSTWTNFFIAGEGPEDGYDMLVVGEPGRRGPTHYSVTGTRNREGVIFAEGQASSWDEACRLAQIEARRASIKLVQ